jgi:hypothetical protein
VSSNNSWTSEKPNVQAFATSYDIEQATTGNTGPTNSLLDLYELIPSGSAGSNGLGGAGTLLGTFNLTSAGVLDFTSAAVAAPEPSTYALLLSGLGLLVWFKRTRRNSTVS